MDSGITALSPVSSMSQGVCILVQNVSPWQHCDHGQAFRRLESVLLYGFMLIYLFLCVAVFHRSTFIFSSDKHYSGAGNAIILYIFLLLFHTEGAQFPSNMTSTIVEYQNNIVFQLYFIFISFFLLKLAWDTEFENLNTIKLLTIKQQFLEFWSNFSTYLSSKSGTINLWNTI